MSMAWASGFSPHCGTTYWPNGTSTTIEPEWSAAIGRSSAGRVVGMDRTPSGLPGQPASRAPSTATTAIAGQAQRRAVPGEEPARTSRSTAAPASRAAPTSASRAIRSASRKVDSPGTRMNQVYGMRAETRSPPQLWASGTYVCPADLQHRAERERRAAQPQQREQPGAPPPPADDQARHREQAQHHPERVQVLQGGLPEVDMAQAGQPGIIGQPR